MARIFITGSADDLSLAPVTQAWLAASDDPAARVTGSYFYHQRPREVHPAAHDSAFQDRLVDYCASLTGITRPAPSATNSSLRPMRQAGRAR